MNKGHNISQNSPQHYDILYTFTACDLQDCIGVTHMQPRRHWSRPKQKFACPRPTDCHLRSDCRTFFLIHLFFSSILPPNLPIFWWEIGNFYNESFPLVILQCFLWSASIYDTFPWIRLLCMSVVTKYCIALTHPGLRILVSEKQN